MGLVCDLFCYNTGACRSSIPAPVEYALLWHLSLIHIFGLCNLYSSFAVLKDFPGSLAAQLADSPLKASDSGLSGVQPDDRCV